MVVGKNEKLESFKLESLKLKVSLKLESFVAVGNFWLKLENSNELGKFIISSKLGLGKLIN